MELTLTRVGSAVSVVSWALGWPWLITTAVIISVSICLSIPCPPVWLCRGEGEGRIVISDRKGRARREGGGGGFLPKCFLAFLEGTKGRKDVRREGNPIDLIDSNWNHWQVNLSPLNAPLLSTCQWRL